MLHFSCDLCGRQLDDQRYVVRLEVFPSFDPEEIEEDDLDADHLQEISEELHEMELTGKNAIEDCDARDFRFELQDGDVAIRCNFCTLDGDGNITDRRAGRIPTEQSAPLAVRLREVQIPGVEVFVEPVKEHRFVVVFRGEPTSNSGVFFHTDMSTRDARLHLAKGYEVNMNNSAREKQKTGSLYAVVGVIDI